MRWPCNLLRVEFVFKPNAVLVIGFESRTIMLALLGLGVKVRFLP